MTHKRLYPLQKKLCILLILIITYVSIPVQAQPLYSDKEEIPEYSTDINLGNTHEESEFPLSQEEPNNPEPDDETVTEDPELDLDPDEELGLELDDNENADKGSGEETESDINDIINDIINDTMPNNNTLDQLIQLYSAFSSAEDLQTAVDDSESVAIIEIDSDMDFNGTTIVIPHNKEITIKSEAGQAYVLTQNENRHFKVLGKLILEDIILDTPEVHGRSTRDADKRTHAFHGGIYVNAGGTLQLNNNTVIQNCINNLEELAGEKTTDRGNGGGIYAENAEIIINSGAIVQSSTARYNGGGIYAIDSAVTMNGGTLTDNLSGALGVFDMAGPKHPDGGGGIHVYGNSTFNMNGGSITENKSGSRSGGGVQVSAGTLFTMTDGSISYNESDNFGGGVMVGTNSTNSIGSRFIMNGGSIDNNTAYAINEADCMGGGVSVHLNCDFIMNAGTIAYNYSNMGGGVSVGNLIWRNSNYPVMHASFTMTDGTIENNRARQTGGGVFIYNDEAKYNPDPNDKPYSASFEMTGGEISGNEAETLYGGGISILYNSEVTISDGFITDNTAKTQGGGIFNSNYDYISPLPLTAYDNLNISEDVVFADNTANNYYNPPVNAADISHLKSKTTSFSDSNLIHPNHILNNYDLNYFNDPSDNFIVVTYHANGGIGSHMDTTIAANTYTIKTLEQTGITRTGYTFTGWKDDNGADYIPSDDIILTEDLDLYAQWENTPENPLKVTYHPNGGIGSHIDTITSGSTYTIKTRAQTGITREGYTFTGWKDGGGNDYAPSSVITLTANLDLYAQWNKDSGSGGSSGGGGTSYTVTYDANGGIGGHKDRVSLGQNYTVRTLAYTGITREGYTFINWNTKADGSGISYNEKDRFTIKGDVILYAQWKPMELLDKENHMAYIVGYPDNTVRPESNVTRAETATIFFRLLTEEARTYYFAENNAFTDISQNDWYNNAVSTVANAGIVAGYTDNTFKGNTFITRAEFAAIAARFDSQTYNGTDKFSDISGHWAADEINKAAEKGWISGYPDGTFKPEQYITRAEAVSLINRVLERNNIHSFHEAMILWPDNKKDSWYYEAMQEATNSHNYIRNETGFEIWTEITPNPDWASLENPK